MKTVSANSTQQLNQKIIDDFKEFKNSNELVYCSMHQQTKHTNCSIVRFSTTIRYSEDLNESLINQNFYHFSQDNNDDYCFISKVNCQDNIYVAEFSLERMYYTK